MSFHDKSVKLSPRRSFVAGGELTSRWFKDEVHPHDSQLKAYLRYSFPAVRDVEDVVQESYLRIWKAHAKQTIDSPKAFLFKIAQRLALDAIRHSRASPIEPAVSDFSKSSVVENRPGVAETASVNQEIALLLEAIDTLPSRCREILILHKLKRLSQLEVAARLGISGQTVRVQIARAVHRCEVYLLKKGVNLC